MISICIIAFTKESEFLSLRFLELLKQNTINSLMILQNLFTSGKFLGNMEITRSGLNFPTQMLCLPSI